MALVCTMLCLPFFSLVHSLGPIDEGLLLHGADRMLRGERLYIDFFEFLPPGGFALFAAWFAVIGTSLWAARCMALVAIVGIACLTYQSCYEASRRAGLSALCAVGWFIMSQGDLTLVSHHWFATLFSMVAAWAAVASVARPQGWRFGPLVAGLAAGAAGMVVHTRGAAALAAVAVAFVGSPRGRAELFAALLAAAIVPAGLFVYVAAHGAVSAAFQDVVIWPMHHYVSVNRMPYAYGVNDQNRLLEYLFPLAAGLAALIIVVRWRTALRDRMLRTCAGFGLAGLVGFMPRPDIAHIAFSAPLVLPLVAYCVSQLTERWSARLRYLAAAIVVVVCWKSLIVFGALTNRALAAEVVATPRGDMTYFGYPPGVPALLARMAETPAADTYLFYPYVSMLPFLTGRHQASKYDLFTPGYTSPAQYQDACLSAVGGASWVVIDRDWTDAKTLRGTFPTMVDFRPKETARFEEAIDNAFQLVWQSGTFELRRRRAAVDDNVCATIADSNADGSR